MIFEQDIRVAKAVVNRQWSVKLAERIRLNDALLLWLSIVLIGTITGAMMNVINSWLSSIYLVQAFAKPGAVWSQLPAEFIWHGARYGTIMGATFGSLLLFHAMMHSKLACPAPLIVSILPKIVLVVWLCWIEMGINAIALFWLSPELSIFSYARVIRDNTAWGTNVMKASGYVWVLGSPIGASVGVVMALFFNYLWFKRDWQKHNLTTS